MKLTHFYESKVQNQSLTIEISTKKIEIFFWLIYIIFILICCNEEAMKIPSSHEAATTSSKEAHTAKFLQKVIDTIRKIGVEFDVLFPTNKEKHTLIWLLNSQVMEHDHMEIVARDVVHAMYGTMTMVAVSKDEQEAMNRICYSCDYHPNRLS